MPKMRAPKVKPDPLKGLILERQKALSKSAEEMSKLMGVSRTTYSELMNKRHTDEWKMGVLKNACTVLSIPIDEFRQAVHYR